MYALSNSAPLIPLSFATFLSPSAFKLLLVALLPESGRVSSRGSRFSVHRGVIANHCFSESFDFRVLCLFYGQLAVIDVDRSRP